MIFTIIWGIVGLLAGICVVGVLPWVGARLEGGDRVEAIADKYVWLAQTCAGRGSLVVRDGDVKLVGKSYDEEQKADKDKAAGDARHHRDSFDSLGRLANKVFGFALTSRDVYVSPLLAELGERKKEAMDKGQIGVSRPAQGQNALAEREMVDGFTVPATSTLVDLSKARHLTTGSAEPEDGQESYTKTKISQEKYHRRMSPGQYLILIVAALGSMLTAWFVASRDASAAADTSINIIPLLFIPWLSSDDDADEDAAELSPAERIAADLRQANPFGRASFWMMVVGVPLVIVGLAAVTYGLLHALLVAVVMLITAGGIVGGIALLGPSIPQFIGVPLARLFWVFAQLTVGRGVLVERDSGAIEHRKLHDAPAGVDTPYCAVLSDGKLLPIDGSPGDFFRFGWAPMAATAEKTDENMGRFSHDVPGKAATDGGYVPINDVRYGHQPVIPVPATNEWTVTGPRLTTVCEKTSTSTAIRQGRSKAMTEHGGEQQLSNKWFLVSILLCIVVGGVFGLIAGGAIL